MSIVTCVMESLHFIASFRSSSRNLSGRFTLVETSQEGGCKGFQHLLPDVPCVLLGAVEWP